MWNIPKLVKAPIMRTVASLDRGFIALLLTELIAARTDMGETEKGQLLSQQMACQIFAEYAHLRLEQPACFVPSHLAELFRRSKYDVNICGLRLPIDSFQLVFQQGFQTSDGFPLDSIHVFNLRSKLCESFFDAVAKTELSDTRLAEWSDALNSNGEAEIARQLKFLPRLFEGFRTATREHLFFYPCFAGAQIGLRAMRLEEVAVRTQEIQEIGRPTASGRKVTPEAIFDATNIAIAALCRYTTRPETVKDFVLPRSERYNHKGDKKQKKIFCFLDPKIVNQRSTKPGEEPAYSVKPHVRGFVYATLRDERWYRKNPLKPGEPLRIQEREPTIIHPESFEAAV